MVKERAVTRAKMDISVRDVLSAGEVDDASFVRTMVALSQWRIKSFSR